MSEPYLRQSPLAHLGLLARADGARGEAGIAMAERRFLRIVALRGDATEKAVADGAEAALGVALPTEPCTAAAKDALTVLWIGPDEWWVVAPDEGPDPAESLRQALADQHAAVTELGDSRACIRVSGPRARDLLAKGCSLDLHPRVFPPGRCAGTLLAKAAVVLHQTAGDDDPNGPAYDLYVLRSFAEYLWRWLEDAAREYGLTIIDA